MRRLRRSCVPVLPLYEGRAHLQAIVLLEEALGRWTGRLGADGQVFALLAQNVQLVLEGGRPAFVVFALFAQRGPLVFLLLGDGGCGIL